MKKIVFTLLVVFSLSFIPLVAQAIPVLQLYVEGGTYDTTLQTWVITTPNFKLWVLGNVSGPGGQGAISDVFLVASGYGAGTVSISSTTTAIVPDPSTPVAPTGPFTAATVPKSPPNGVTNHAEYSGADDHNFYGIGNFTLTDSPMADLIGSFPAFPSVAWTNNSGQINAYNVAITGYDEVHFDAYDTVVSGQNGTRVVFAPFSHDSSGGGGDVAPEPGTLLLLGSGLVGLFGYGRLRLQGRKK